MLVLNILLVTVSIIVLGSIVPLFQLVHSKKRKTTTYRYVFSDDLINFDMNTGIKSDVISRAKLATRGWVRGPHGSIMTQEDFEKKKEMEYSIQLP
jgi:hypothetical protein